MTRRRILALSPIPEEGAGCRFRVSQFAPYLAAAGFDIDIHPLFDTSFFRLVYKPGHYVRKATGLASRTFDRIGAINRGARIDAVLIYREAYPVGPPVFERLIAKRRIPIVYDFDDAVYLGNTSQANRVIGFLKNPDKVAEILRLSTRVIAGNEYLARYARRHSARVTVIPTCVDTAVWVPGERRSAEAGTTVIGWIGTPTTTPYLLELRDVLVELARTHRFRLRVSGSLQPVDVPGVDVENVPWTLEREVELFNTCDIGIYPLPDDDWTRGKCGFKAIQFMASGVPVVASPVGVNREIISDGADGFFASGAGDWVAKLRALIDDRELRQRVGLAGRETIERRYSLAANAPRVVAIFEEVTTGAHRQAS